MVIVIQSLKKMFMLEIWKDLPGHEGFLQISNTAKIRSLDRWVNTRWGTKKLIKSQLLKPFVDSGGYVHLCFSKYGKRTHLKMHRAMAIAFIPNPKNLPQINHKNGIKTDNRIENLEWCTAKHNSIHAVKSGLSKPMVGSKNGCAKLNEQIVKVIFDTRGTKSAKKWADELGVGSHRITAIFRGDSWNHVTGLIRRERDGNRRIIQNKNPYNYITRPFVNCRGK